jgi:23S rRNA maturation mini-RNase III
MEAVIGFLVLADNRWKSMEAVIGFLVLADNRRKSMEAVEREVREK